MDASNDNRLEKELAMAEAEERQAELLYNMASLRSANARLRLELARAKAAWWSRRSAAPSVAEYKYLAVWNAEYSKFTGVLEAVELKAALLDGVKPGPFVSYVQISEKEFFDWKENRAFEAARDEKPRLAMTARLDPNGELLLDGSSSAIGVYV